MCILLVEDEALIRLVFGEELIDAGYHVQEAPSGDAAAALIEERGGDFSLLVTDVQMPGRCTGPDVAEILRRYRPDVPVIYMTGRPDMLPDNALLGERDVVMAKPFAASALIAAVRSLLPPGPQPSC